jgi:hypothetical protein
MWWTVLAMAADVRPVDAFTAVDGVGSVAVEITVGEAQQVTVEEPPECAGGVTVEAVDGVLRVGSTGDCRGFRRVMVSVPSLQRAVTSGSGALQVRGAVGDVFELRTTGSGSARGQGAPGTLRVVTSGSGAVHWEGLASSSAVEVSLTGSGGVTLRGAAASLTVSDSGSGTVDVSGLAVE